MQATKLVFVPSSARNKHMQIEAKCNVAPVNRVAGKSGGRDRNRGNKEGETRTLSLWLKGGFPRERGKWLANSNLFRNCLGRCVIDQPLRSIHFPWFAYFRVALCCFVYSSTFSIVLVRNRKWSL